MQTEFIYMKKIYALFIFISFVAVSHGQISITALGSAFSQNFDGMGSSATAALPTGFKIGTDWATGTSATTLAAGSTGTGALTTTSGGGVYNFANGITASSTDRAVGFLTSGSFSSPRSIVLKFTNNTGLSISSLSISFDFEKYRNGTRAFDWTFFHGNISTPSIAETAGNQSYVADGAIAVLNPPTAISKTISLSGLTIPDGTDYYLKWTFTGVGGSSNSQAIAIDNFSITASGGGTDVTAPTVTTLTPTDNATNVFTNTNLQIVFNEPIAKGIGNVLLKKLSDNAIVQTIDVTNAIVSVVGSTATITINPLLNSTDYYVEIDAGAFTDIALNNFAGITGNSTWNFTTSAPPAAGIISNNYSFTNCATTFLAEGWSQYSVAGTQSWACVTPGRTAAPDNGIVMNAFVSAGNNPLNEDWLISPVFDLSAVNLPTLKFYSKGDFIGNSLQLKISNNYTAGTNPNTATWTNLTGNFPANVAAQGSWTLSDNIDLSAFNTAGITIAWVYINPTTANSSRWTIDDVTLYPNIVLLPCIEPIDQPTNLVLTATAASVSGTFTEIPAPTSVQNYLVVRSLTNSLTQLPVDATNYTTGQIIGGGNGTVIGISANGTFTDNNVNPSTQYYYFIFAMEDQSCTGGPNYNQLLPLTSGVITPALAVCTTPAAPTALVLTPANTSVSATFTGTGASKYLVVRSATVPPLGATTTDGTIYTAGQTFGNGTVISITTNTNFVATGLTVSTPYYFYVFALNDACTGAPFYSSTSLDGTITTTNAATGIPPGYYDAAATLTCQPLKTALKNIITAGSQVLGYTPGIWNIYQFSDLHRNDANTADIIWDMYSDNPTGPEPYVFSYGPAPSPNPSNIRGQCGTYANEGDCYNREHSTPQSWFGSINPMVSDAHHIFATDGKVNGIRSNYPYGEVSTASYTSQNGSKLGTGSNFGYTGTVFEPINAYKGDFARAGLYMITRYEDEVISQNWSGQGTGNSVFLSTTDEPDAAKRKLQMYDAYYLKTLIKWHNQDPVSQKEIDRNNAIYYTAVNTTPVAQGNRNPYVDHPEYAALIFQCTGLLPVTLTDFTAQKNKESVLLKWYATYETSFKQYDVERSTDGFTFNKIGEVAGINLTNYSFTDNNLPKGTVLYYRLKMIDQDGKFNNSKIISVKLNNNLSNALVFPNPTMDNLTIRLYDLLVSNSILNITDVTGRLVKQTSVNLNTTNIRLDVKDLPAGRYFIKIINSAQIINESFVIIK